MIKVAVFGANGLLGQGLLSYLSSSYTIIPITRENYEQKKGKSFDVFINANGNSKRFWALENPLADFEASTASVYKTLFDFSFKKYIYISSSDVYSNPNDSITTQENSETDVRNLNAYGLHKYLSEQIVKNRVENYMILRSSMILGKAVSKGPFFDIKQKQPIFITLDSKLQLITIRAIAEVITALLSKNLKNEIYNMGGKGSFDFGNINKYFSEKIEVSDRALRQHYEMNVSNLQGIYRLKTSEEYLQEYLNG